MGYIKSNSKYVIQEKHQNIKNGAIFERDFATIGGISDYPKKGQKYYRNGTFVFGVNDAIVRPSYYASQEWSSNNGNDFWIGEEIISSPKQESLDIVLKQDIYKLKDFAYYGSCAELIRSSINDIIQRFPGELHSPYNGIIVTNQNNQQIGVGNIKYYIDNPFNLNLHTEENNLTIDEKNNLLFVQGNFIEKYDVFNGDAKFASCNIKYTDIEDQNKNSLFGRIEISGTTSDNEKKVIIIDCHKTESCDIIYLTDTPNISIRPKNEYYEIFINSLDEFQKLLLNEYSTPKYNVIFEVMDETEYGYQIKYESFIFPLGHGGYNLGVTTEKFGIYLSKLSKYAEFFDNLYCHNLYRSLTHESIKNFDWTRTLNRGEETIEDYQDGGSLIQKMLNVCGRELDEIKFYIDGIKNVHNISYNESSNLPDYFLTDTLNIDGWDIINVFPYSGDTLNNYVECRNEIVKPYGNMKYGNCGSIIDFPIGYFSCFSSKDKCEISKINADSNFMVDAYDYLRNKIKQYVNERPYTMYEMNNKFMKMLKLNSREILRHKGTIEGIEMLLSLFGLKSKRWYESFTQWGGNRQSRFKDNMQNSSWDYEIDEYIAITDALIDNDNNPVDEYNKKKSIIYDTNEYRNGIYIPYQGLPVRLYESMDGTKYLCPYFSYNKIIDGNPYYQMYGGWAFHNDTYTDTNTQIPMVEKIPDLFKITSSHLYDGIIYKVNNLNGEWVCLENTLFDIKYRGEDAYISFIVENHAVVIGGEMWENEITISAPNNEEKTVDLKDYRDGSELQVFIHSNDVIIIAQDDKAVTNYRVLKNGMYTNGGTNYFQLYTVENRFNFGVWGWNQLTENNTVYKTIQNINRDFNANNPHQNGLSYDDGVEYLEYFRQIFKYAIENEEFNVNCFSDFNDYMRQLNKIAQCGFSNLINDEEDGCNKTINKQLSSKINYYGDYYISGDTEYVFNEIKSSSSATHEYNIWDVYDSISSSQSNIGFLDQIVNLKNVTIKFFIPYEESAAIKKYYDSIILHYLLQIIPSNTILKIDYYFKES